MLDKVRMTEAIDMAAEPYSREPDATVTDNSDSGAEGEASNG